MPTRQPEARHRHLGHGRPDSRPAERLAPPGYRCPFCAITTGAEAACVVARSAGAVAAVSLGQVATNHGAVLVFPTVHAEALWHTPEAALGECIALARRVAQAQLAALGCEGVTLRQNNGVASGQDVWHLHFHVVPRWRGDRWGREAPVAMPEPERAGLAARLREVLAGSG